MTTLIEQRLEKLKKAIQEVPVDAMFETVTQAATAQIEQKNHKQLYQGLDGFGQNIEPPYTPKTVAIKQAKGQVWDRVTAKDTGSFWDSIAPDINSKGFEMNASDSKAAMLNEKYGELVGLSPQSMEELKQEVYKPGIRNQLEDYFEREMS